MAVVVDDVDRAGVYARSPQGRRVQPAATNRHSHTSTRRWCVGGLAVKQDAYDRSRDFPAQSITIADALDGFLCRLLNPTEANSHLSIDEIRKIIMRSHFL